MVASINSELKEGWIPAGQPITVAGLELTGGLLYCSSRSAPEEILDEPSKIDMSLDVFEGEVDQRIGLMGYGPNYSAASPQARKAYLTWLFDGRSSPDTHISNVLLFYAGLERRVLVDLKLSGGTCSEVESIRNEVSRLRDVYFANEIFYTVSTLFLAYIDAECTGIRGYLRAPPNVRKRTRETLIHLRVALGHAAADEVALHPDWALSWVLGDSGFDIPKILATDLSLFSNIFREIFLSELGDGLYLESPRSTLEFVYRPASRSLFNTPFFCNSVGSVEAAGQSVAKRILQRLIDLCAERVAISRSKTSRYFGERKSDEPGVRGEKLQINSTVRPFAGGLTKKSTNGPLVSKIGGRSIIGHKPVLQPPKRERSYASPNKLKLDYSKIAVIQSETSAVAELLADTFKSHSVEDVHITQEMPSKDDPSRCCILGLDSELSDFLRLLLKQKLWSREELNGAATEFQLMLDGALERINEAALEIASSPLIEGEDPLEINYDILERLSL
ncbi:TerB N-terminal domain-containing protein [Aromatoleum toluclasticum]|uniref:TerB N-terminal domain-containing protein n=1 Tax=Aromatoleum toluclasticum TaxID=92003 RepID=UPI0003A273A8|nr:TerB N-terminal domain-containing protein [Aromatoleum toluclasticum]